MKLPRRHFLRLAAGAAALPAMTRFARAQTYPTRPVRLLVGFAAGGPTDISARLIGQGLSDRLGQSVVIENRPGAASNIAAEAVVKAPPDGYTLLQVTITNAINTTLYDNLNFNLLRDLAPVAGVNRAPGVMVVNLSSREKTVPEFIAYARANPGKINMATAGSGSGPDIYGALFRMMVGVDLVPIAYRGAAPALVDLMGGQVQVMFVPLSSAIELIRAGRLRPLAVTTGTRLEVLPDVPTISEFVSGYDASTWNGICAPRNTPPEIIARLNKEVNLTLADPQIRARIADLGSVPLTGSSDDFGKLIAEETERLAKVVKFAGMKPE
jgi:tripartite-type tricarboxylate transporter receptor subunit TctC